MLKRIALTLALVAVLSTPASALDFQHKLWYVQGIVALPVGNFSDFANFGFGGGVGLHVPHSAEWSFRGEASYIYFLTDDLEGVESSSASIIPISVLAQYDIENSRFYALGGVGLAFVSSSVTYDVGDVSDTNTEFSLILGAGYNFSPRVDFGVRYNLISDANYFSGHVAYKF